MTPAELKIRGEKASQLLSDRLLQDSLDAIESEILQTWEACPVRDAEGREELWRLYKTAKKFRGVLMGAVESGKVVLGRERELSPFMKAVEPFSRVLRSNFNK